MLVLGDKMGHGGEIKRQKGYVVMVVENRGLLLEREARKGVGDGIGMNMSYMENMWCVTECQVRQRMSGMGRALEHPSLIVYNGKVV